jgi:hypothetical protein
MTEKENAAVERRKASALRQGRTAPAGRGDYQVRLSALRSPRLFREGQKAKIGGPGAFKNSSHRAA